ncbi:30049_t:CDS:1, partial [Racocetra persica]
MNNTENESNNKDNKDVKTSVTPKTSPKVASKEINKVTTTNHKKVNKKESNSRARLLSRCTHPKHEVYTEKTTKPPATSPPSKKRKNNQGKEVTYDVEGRALVPMPKRLEGVLNIDRGSLMCRPCLAKTDKDPE